MKFRSKKATDISADRGVLQILYRLLQSHRPDIVDAFYCIKDRRLREAYDSFAFMMIKLDKLIQFLRRILNEDLYTTYPRPSPRELDELLFKLPIEMVLVVRNFIQTVKLLKELAPTMPAPYINSIVKSLGDIIDDMAKYIDRIVF